MKMAPIQEKLKLFADHKVVNWHEHVWLDKDYNLDLARSDGLAEDAARTHTDTLVCSLPVIAQTATPEEFRHANDTLYLAMKRYPGLIKGFAFVNPGYVKESLCEIDRCVREYGMIGIKLYYQYYISDPVVRDLIEKCIDLDIPILVHASKLNYHPETQPFVSNGVHFARAGKEYPQARFVMAHIGGGGDWEWSLKAIADYPNVYTDMSGSVYDDQMLERAVDLLGAKRILFGTDGSYSACIGKMLGCSLSESDKICILNNPDFERYLKR
jgi:predicted TIM-barrel fold metal-dependent hydrolase